MRFVSASMNAENFHDSVKEVTLIEDTFSCFCHTSVSEVFQEKSTDLRNERIICENRDTLTQKVKLHAVTLFF